MKRGYLQCAGGLMITEIASSLDIQQLENKTEN